MKNIAPLAPVKIYTTGREPRQISQINFRAPFGRDPNVLRYTAYFLPHKHIPLTFYPPSRVKNFAVGPSTSNLVNLTTCDPALYHGIGKYHTVTSTSDSKANPTLFY